MTEPTTTANPRIIGLIAGQGNFPLLLADGAREAGVEVIAFGVHSLVNEELKQRASHFYTLKLTELSRLFELCNQHGVRHLIMAGRVPHKVLLRQVSLDPRALKIIGRLGNNKANSLLKAATQEIEEAGIHVLDSTTFLHSCLPVPGLLTPNVPLDDNARADIEFGYPLAKSIAGHDIGQSITVKNRIVVGVEAVEGTDKLIDRSAELADGGFVLVKVSKPDQDMRFDVPVIGITTIKHLVRARARAICVTAGKTLFLDREQAVAMAEENGISIYAFDEAAGR